MGNSSFGDFLPGYFAEAGLKEIKVYQSDKTSPIYPPYSSPEELVLLKTWNRWADNKEGPYDYRQSLEYFKAVSEEEEHMDFFYRQWEKNIAEMKLINQGVDKKQYHMGGAYIMYVTSGVK